MLPLNPPLTSREIRRCAWLRSASGALALAAGLVGLLVLAGGWILDVAVMRSIVPGAASMKTNTAVALTISASALLMDRTRGKALTRLVPVLGTVLILISLATLLEYGTGRNLGIDELMFTDRATSATPPGRMAAITAVIFLLLGVAIRLRNRPLWSQFFSAGAAVLCFANLVGHLYGIRNFGGMEFYTGMAVPTSSSLSMLALSMLLAQPDRGLMALAISENLGGVLARRLLPAAVGAPVFLGWLMWQEELKGLYGSAFGVALFATANVAVFACLIWTAAWRLDKIDAEKTRATAVLRARENLLNTFVKRVPAEVAMLDRDMRYVQASDRWCSDYHLDGSELPGRSHYELFPDIPERWKTVHRRCLAGETLRHEEDLWERAHGEAIWRRWEVLPWGEQNGLPEGILIFTEDITKRKKEELELRKFVSLAHNSAEFIGMCDMNLMPFYVNPAALQLVGLDSLEQAMQTPLIELFFPEDRRFIIEEFIPRVVREGRAEVEIRFRHFKTDKPLWMIYNVFHIRDAANQPVALATVSRDITERRRTEDLLRESEERFRNMADTAPVLIWISGPDKFCTFFNKVWLEFTGRALEQELGSGWTEGVHPDDLYRCLAIYSSSFDKRERFQMEYRLRRADGAYRWLLDMGVPRFTADGVFEGYIGSCVDVTEFKRAQERFRLVVEASPAAIVMVDRKGTIVLVNSRTEKLFGYGRHELVGRPVEILVPERSREKLQKLRNKLFLQGEARPMGTVNDLYGRRKDDAQFPVEIGLDPIETEEGSCVLASIVDIGKRRRTESAMREALQQLQLITDNMAAGVARCSRDLRYMWVNPSYAAWLGRRGPGEVAGRPMADVMGPDFNEAMEPYIEKVLSGERVEFETRVPYPGAGKRWIHSVYVPIRGQQHDIDGWIAVVADITERHEAEERLRDSEERFRATFFQAAVGIAQTSIDGQLLMLNDRFCEILGYSQDELREKTFIEITHPDDREASRETVRELLGGKASEYLEKRYIRKDGVTVWANVFVSLVRGINNAPRYFVAVLDDITEKKHAERALQESRRELRALAGRLIHAQEEERRRISRQLHDDLSQRLALLALDAGGLALAPSRSPDQIKETLANLHSKIVQVSADIRRISHELHPSILEDLGLAAALREVCEEFSVREGIEATLEQEKTPERLPTDVASCLYWIAKEALHNVSKYAHASHVRVSLSGGPKGIQISIHDDGAGFNPQDGRGHGLGIISMKERAIMVQGELSIRSQPGQGTEVRAFVPLANGS